MARPADREKNAKVKKSKGAQVKQKREPKWKATVKEIEEVSGKYESLDTIQISQFSHLPLSSATSQGLRACGYTHPTDIQKAAIPLALRGTDILGAAKTGSGKTLAFLVPLLELLWRERWGSMDGMGALVISPTRELAYQTFEVLRKVGSHHDFSAGLVTGGKDIAMEKDHIQNTNIVICTPGRLLQHMDETANFDCSSLQILILDEADRILDLGFQHTVNAILENLPTHRQTLLFSATQTRSVRDLARLSLEEPEYVAVHENSKCSTPHRLTQSYVRCKLPDKLSVLFSFLRSHVTSKIIVFMSSCKQVKFVYEAFRRLRPGVPLMALYGRQKHLKRMAIYNDFCRKKASILFCTDIAARGLDIPSVNWVVQLDCPEDANTYIHRVGRTARYEKAGKGLLFLLPSEEEGMLAELRAKKIPIEQIRVNPRKVVSIQKKLEGLCAQNTELKQSAQRSFICYLRSVHLQSNKTIFDVHQLPAEEYAASLGLPRPPRVRFLQRVTKKGSLEGEEEERREERESEAEKEEVLFVKRVIPVGGCGSAEDGSAIEAVEQERRQCRPESNGHTHARPASKVSSIKKMLNKKLKLNSHIKFDDEGELVEGNEDIDADDMDASDSNTPMPFAGYDEEVEGEGLRKAVGGIHILEAQRKLRARDTVDRDAEKTRIRRVHRERRWKGKQRGTDDNSVTVAELDEVSARPGTEPDGLSEDKVAVVLGEKRKREGSGGKRKKSKGEGAELARNKGSGKRLGTGPKVELLDDEELAKHLLGI